MRDRFRLASVSVKIEEQAVSLDIYHIENDFVKFLSNDGDHISVKDNGVYICTRIANEYELQIGDEIEIAPYGETETYTLEIAGILIGIPLGYLVLDYLILTMASEYETVVHIEGSTYAISIFLCVGVTLFIVLMISRKN